MPRVRCSAVVRLVVSVGLVCLIWLQMQLISQRPFTSDGGTQTRILRNSSFLICRITDESLSSNDTSAAVLAMVPPILHKFLQTKPKNITNQGESSQRNCARLYFNMSRLTRNQFFRVSIRSVSPHQHIGDSAKHS
jgi:hypothetical protein